MNKESNMPLENRTIVITGATGGLGSALTRALAAGGAGLALLDRHPEQMETLTAELALPASRLLTLILDLGDPTQVQAAAASAAAHFGRLDGLVHLAGGWTGGKTLLETPVTDLEFMLNQHVWTSFTVVQAFVPYLVQNRWGRVVMVTSPLAARPAAKSGAYAIGKAGQEALMLALAQELKGSGVTANLLHVKSIDAKREKISAPTPANAAWTTPEELIAAILYLFTEAAGNVNGARLPLFGGGY
jgi:NAD(P)-dependent dehydrogenase (short-subunit alcohol dehydrogenase family)